MQQDSNGVEKLKSVMLGLKKRNRVTYSNKRMQLVKIDYWAKLTKKHLM